MYDFVEGLKGASCSLLFLKRKKNNKRGKLVGAFEVRNGNSGKKKKKNKKRKRKKS